MVPVHDIVKEIKLTELWWNTRTFFVCILSGRPTDDLRYVMLPMDFDALFKEKSNNFPMVGKRCLMKCSSCTELRTTLKYSAYDMEMTMFGGAI